MRAITVSQIVTASDLIVVKIQINEYNFYQLQKWKGFHLARYLAGILRSPHIFGDGNDGILFDLNRKTDLT